MADADARRRCYVETSALLAALLEKQPSARKAIEHAADRYSSRLTFTEARRTVVRARAAGQLSAAQERAAALALQSFESECDTVPVTDEILERAARPFPVEPLRTLDAIHLATAEFPGDPPALVTVITRDHRVRANAVAMGFQVG